MKAVEPVSALVMLCFTVVGLLGLYGALWPEKFIRQILAEWQQKKLSADSRKVFPWVGWVIFAFCAIIVVLMSVDILSE